MGVHDVLLHYLIVIFLEPIRVVDKVYALSLTPVFGLTDINLAPRVLLH